MKVLAVLALIALLVLPASAQNLVVNPGFEASSTALTGWTNWAGGWGSGCTQTLDASIKVSGARSARMQISNGGQGSFGIFQIIAVTPGQQYNFSTWVRNTTAASSSNWNEVLLFNRTATASDIDSGSVSGPFKIWSTNAPTVATAGGPGDSWQKITGTVTSTTGYVTIAYKWGHSGSGFGGGSLRIDDVSLTAVPEPSSIIALGTGLMGLAGFVVRRRK